MGILFVVGLFAVLNVYSFVLMGYDKRQAKRHGRRVPERTLFLLSFVGGCIGISLGMEKFRHKTQHKSFRILVPLSFVVVALVYGSLLKLMF
ncbi:DUF1294 domain-containing protein [Tumebacillus permanentifrigoris]|uniref:Uncharacterized membrane protein YsdA (DUF1294 family) n=1 Tax=Tumebacillus permanentifrigoris TaxID=378543 RepID=A0A316DC88_9BACL|nr:DUF1294 domain-containing protein [Tumebacillus permanentifrigoris]PWK14907.1 uncharacterized membrane protein YsdA (DUF1294 family) [Tumebacillus permanentifrigoris]